MQKQLLHQFFKRLDPEIPFNIVYWNNTRKKYGKGNPAFTLMFTEKIAAGRFAKEPSITFGEAYMDGKIMIDGRIEDVIRLVYANERQIRKKKTAAAARRTIRRQKKEVQHHYDLGNEFYGLWLDETFSYSCAYFDSPENTLDVAQVNKVDHVLKKLQLKPGEKLLDIGSGWGWLLIRAVEKYGVEAYGITLSEEQYQAANERIAARGLEGKIQVELLDYRQLPETGKTFDKIASVGMFEHVGPKNYPRFMEIIKKLLNPGGIGLLHTITRQKEQPVDPWIQKYIFPGGHIPSVREIVSLFPDYELYLQDVESLRLHYAKTLDSWSARFEKHVPEIEQMHDERFVKMWRLYLQSSAAFFRLGGLDIHQFMFTKEVNNELEWTRKHLYK